MAGLTADADLVLGSKALSPSATAPGSTARMNVDNRSQ